MNQRNKFFTNRIYGCELVLTFFLGLIINTSIAQEVVSTQGETYTNNTATIDFTIGEVISTTGTDGTNDITQGFHQSNWTLLGLEDYSSSLQVNIFPNPTEDIINIQSNAFENIRFTLYDTQGKIVKQNKLFGKKTVIHVQELAPGNYSLVLHDENQNLKVFKLNKQR